jgi:hypothetical protein
MGASITDLVKQFKQKWTRELEPEMITQACRDSGYHWKERDLGPVATLQLFLLQVLQGNTAINHVIRLAGMAVTASAYCQARARLPLAVFQLLVRRAADALQEEMLDEGRWLGHRTFFVDGSGFSMPDTQELQDHFGQPGAQRPGCGFPVAHMLGLMHSGSGMLTKVLTAPLRTHDMAQAADLHPEMRHGDVLVADRGFCSYVHLALVLRASLQAVFRIHQRQKVDFTAARPNNKPGKKRQKGMPYSRWIRAAAVDDQIVEWFKPRQCPKWMNAEEFTSLPESMIVREVRYRITQPGFRCEEMTLVTTLLDADIYSVDSLATLYLDRWRIETAFGHLKTTMHMDVLRCKTVEGVLKELHVFCLVYNLVRLVMLEASRRQGVPPERISFVDSLRWLATAAVGNPFPSLVVNPHRPNRTEPRVRKRRSKPYPLMTHPRHELRQTLAAKGVAV